MTLDALRASLADRYEIVRELGAGGMATVYLARDLKLQRQVALKVLRPELAQSLGSDRFLREIEIAAQLHHPHILALHDSGEADGFLYYVMPYVEGESLADRIAREGELPIADTVRILREMVDALALAHGRGVVHRDIKPDNVMITGRHALVMDFGIAKALAEATGGAKVTTVGMALGTPTYMSPEQAAADPGVDHRADIYALGATAYEMLTGRPPFTGRTPQEVLAAHITKAPEPIEQLRPAVPAALAELVMRCLAKHPADRPQSADEMLPALEALGTSSGGMTPTSIRPAARRTRPRWLIPAAVVLLLVTVLGITRFNRVGASGTLIGDQVLAQNDLILVGEFTNETADSTLGHAITDAMRASLQQSQVVRVLGQREMWDALERMERDPGQVQPDNVVRELAERVGAKAYIVGTVRPLGGGYQITARVIATLDGQEVGGALASAAGEGELIGAITELGRQLRTDIGESLRDVRGAPGLADVWTPSLAALRTYVAAERAWREGRQSEMEVLYREATTIDTAFAAAWMRRSWVARAQDNYLEAVDALNRAHALRDRLDPVDQLWVQAWMQVERGEPTLAEATWRQHLDAGGDPNDFAHFLMLHRRWAEAESVAVIAVRDSADVWRSYFNLIESQVAQRRFAAAESSYARFRQEDAAEDYKESMWYRVKWSQLQFDSIQAAVSSASVPGNPMWNRCLLTTYQGRFEAAGGCYRALGQDAVGADANVMWARARMLGDTTEVAGLIREVLASIDRSDPRNVGVIGVVAEIGKPAEARRLLAEWRRRHGEDDPLFRRERSWVEGRIALAEGNTDSAARAFLGYNRSGFLTGEFDYGRGLFDAGWALDVGGKPDSAITLYEAFLERPMFTGAELVYGSLSYPIALRRLGELYENRGDRNRAMEKYAAFIELWKNADPALQPQVTDARRRLAALAGERGG